MTNSKIVRFVTRGLRGLALGRGHISHLVKLYYFFKNLYLYFGGWFRQDKKTVFMMCTLIPIVFTSYIADFLCHCWFLFILWWDCWYVNISPSDKCIGVDCRVSDTQVTVGLFVVVFFGGFFEGVFCCFFFAWMKNLK